MLHIENVYLPLHLNLHLLYIPKSVYLLNKQFIQTRCNSYAIITSGVSCQQDLDLQIEAVSRFLFYLMVSSVGHKFGFPCTAGTAERLQAVGVNVRFINRFNRQFCSHIYTRPEDQEWTDDAVHFT